MAEWRHKLIANFSKRPICLKFGTHGPLGEQPHFMSQFNIEDLRHSKRTYFIKQTHKPPTSLAICVCRFRSF